MTRGSSRARRNPKVAARGRRAQLGAVGRGRGAGALWHQPPRRLVGVPRRGGRALATTVASGSRCTRPSAVGLVMRRAVWELSGVVYALAS